MSCKEMEFKKVSPYKSEEIGIAFNGGYCFSLDGKNLFIEKSGHIFICDDKIKNAVINRELTEDIALKLLQRNFASLADEDENDLCDFEAKISPTFFMIDLTKKCNMRCKYCLREEYVSGLDKSVSDETIKDICEYIARYCKENNVPKIYVQPWGGEPLLEKEKIYLIQDELNKHNVNHIITIETNGLLLDENILNEMFARDINISISIDGYEKVHDAQRVLVNNGNTHSFVEAALKRVMQKNDGKVSIICTLTKQTYKKVDEIIDYFVYELGLSHIKLNFVHKSKFADNEYMCMSVDEIMECSAKIFDKIVDFHRKGIKVFDYNVCVKVLNVVLNRKVDACISGGCSGGRSLITIDMHGNIFPCDVTDFPEEKMGDIYSGENLVALVEDAVAHNDYFKKKWLDECEECSWYHYCKGGCTVHMKCCGYEGVDKIECSVNRAIYPKIAELILREPNIVNSILEKNIL